MSTSSLRVPAEHALRPALPRPVPTSSRPEARLRDAFDRALALSFLVLAAPVLLVVAAAVQLTSRGPVLFSQRRVGRDGQTFRMLKFRSMIDKAESQEDVLAADSEAGPFFKVKRDTRITPIGRLLRKSSLDELPQLWNVVRGEMRLVGPRPLLIREHAALPSAVRDWRVRVKPGLTGLWQVSGRSRTSAATRLRLDRLYVERSSLRLDGLILMRTPRAVLRADGAV